MKFLKAYILEHKRIIYFLICQCLVFSIIFYLYHLPYVALVYPFLVTGFIGMFFIIFDYYNEWSKHKILERFSNINSDITLINSNSIVEKDYQRIIVNLEKQIVELEELNREIKRETDEYFSIWVHQIKTPISSIKLMLENEDSKYSSIISSELMRIEQYVEMVLVYLRLESKSTDYVFEPVDLISTIKKAISRFATEFIINKIKLELEEIDTVLITDDKWLLFVIEQLLSNSLKYTPKGKIKIFMPDSNSLCISDDGIGIAPEDLPRIFEKGFTGFNGRQSKNSSGIGLYLVKRVCKNLGLDINITSNIGRGTSVLLNFDQKELYFD